jgi:glycosyltransferase involved in cell wall biosynthesis
LWTPCHHRLERWALAIELLPRRLDVFHSPDFIPPAFGAKRRVITVHDLNFLYFPHYLTAESRRYYVDQISWAVRVADQIIADSKHTRCDLIERLQVPAGKVTTIYLAANPIYTTVPSAAAVGATLARYNLPRDFILFVGTLEPRKNIPTLLRSYAQVRATAGIDVPLVLVGGEGWLYEEVFHSVEKLKLGEHVRHLRGLADEQLVHLYHAAALLALPSHYEGFGLPPLEAMHCGCPVVVSNRGSLPEIVGSAGMVLDAEDVEAWAEALVRLMGDAGLRERMAKAGHEQAQRFTWRATAQATLRLYEGKC